MDVSEYRIISKRIDELRQRADDETIPEDRREVAQYRLMEARYLYAVLSTPDQIREVIDA